MYLFSAWAVFSMGFLLLASSAVGQSLYVAEYGNSQGIFKITPTGGQSNFVAGLNSPYGLAFDSQENLFVADGGSGSIFEVTPGGVKTTVASGLNTPYSLAFDSKGDLFEADYGSSNIYEFTSNGATLNSSPALFASGLNRPVGLVFNKAGDLFEADFDSGNIYEFTNHNGVLNPHPGLFASGLSKPSGLAFDSTGNLFVANDEPIGSISEITTNGSVSTFGSGLSFPLGLVFDGSGNLFVANQNGNDIIEFTPNQTQSTYASEPEGDFPSGLAFQPIPVLQMAHSNGTCQLSFSMPSPYYSTIVLESSNLVDWAGIYTNTPPFTYSNDCSCPHCYYRAVLEP